MDNALHWLEPVAPHPTSPTQRITLGSGILHLHTSAHERLTALKNEIDSVSSITHWDDAKKITNPYEYIFLSLQKRIHRSVSAIIPLSRSYFKMIELWDLIGLDTIPKPMCSAHGAEGPGGFLEAIQHRTGRTTRMVAMTLRSTERAVPGWRKSQIFLEEHPQIHVSYGADGTGNMYHLPNQAVFAALAHDLARPGVDLYTADGGFDFSTDYNGQENTVHRLLAAEALAGLQSLRQGGIMIIKMFDTKNIATLELMWILSNCFMRTALTKPRTSRPANSERYWIGYGLLATPPAWVTELLTALTATEAPAGWNAIFAAPPWSPTWLAPIQAFQEEVEHHQYDNIQMTLNIIRAPTRPQIYDLLLRNIQNSRAWIAHHRISENRQYVCLRDEQIAALNLEEALAPFQGLAARTSLPALSPPPPTHHVRILIPAQRPQAGPAWRSELPPSIRGYLPSRTAAGTLTPSVTAPPESHEAPDHAPERP